MRFYIYTQNGIRCLIEKKEESVFIKAMSTVPGPWLVNETDVSGPGGEWFIENSMIPSIPITSDEATAILFEARSNGKW